MSGQLPRTDSEFDLGLPDRVRIRIELRGGLPRGGVRISELEGAVVLEGERVSDILALLEEWL